MEGLVGIVALIAAASLRPEALLRHQRRPRLAEVRQATRAQLDELYRSRGTVGDDGCRSST